MSCCNCTSNSERKRWHCIWVLWYGIVMRTWVYGLLVWHQSGIHYNPQRLMFQNTLSHLNLQHYSLSGNKTFCPIAGRDVGNLLSRVVLKFRTSVIQNPFRAVKRRAWALTSFILCYCTATAFQLRRLSVTKSAMANLSLSRECIGILIHVHGFYVS